jgi:hypothetical protein
MTKEDEIRFRAMARRMTKIEARLARIEHQHDNATSLGHLVGSLIRGFSKGQQHAGQELLNNKIEGPIN